jgi:hypothetical protein
MFPVSSITGFAIEELQPSAPPLVVSFIGTDYGTAHIAVQQSETDLVKDLDRESFIRNYPPLAYFSLDKKATQIDPLYRETRNPSYKAPVLIPIFIQLEPSKRLLKKFGLEVEQEAIGLLSQGWLDRHAKELKVKTGDRIGYFDRPYVDDVSQPSGISDEVIIHELQPRTPNFSFEVLTVKFCDYWASSQRPIHIITTLKNLRAPGKPDRDISLKKSNPENVNAQ